MEKETKICSLCLARQGDRVLLALKKSGFGQGYWNGVGGKLDEAKGDTSIEDCANREIQEEIDIVATKISKKGVLNFTFPLHETPNYEVHVFEIEDFEGEPKESDEMKPEWFSLGDIPFEKMWPNDRLWIPIFLEGQKFSGRFSLGEENLVLDYDLEVVDEI